MVVVVIIIIVIIYRHWDDLPTPTLTEELTRLSMEKNMPSAPYIVPPSLSDLVERTVDYLLQLALPHTATANAIKVNRGEGVELRRLHHKMSLSKVLLAKQAKQSNMTYCYFASCWLHDTFFILCGM